MRGRCSLREVLAEGCARLGKAKGSARVPLPESTAHTASLVRALPPLFDHTSEKFLCGCSLNLNLASASRGTGL